MHPLTISPAVFRDAGAAPARAGAGEHPQAVPEGNAQRRSLGIRVAQATRRYGAFCALDRVSLDVAAGEFLTLLGPSGSGKTTLLNILAGFVTMDEGRVYFGGQEVTGLPPHKRGVGIVFQQYALFPHMNVHDNVGFPLQVRKTPAAEIRERVKWALDLVQLGAFSERPVHALSGGQKQRVALARAIVFEPAIILMDEPLSALDKQLRERMQIELRHLHDKLGTTTIYVTHDQREALTMSDRIAVMNRGTIAQLDTPRALYDQPADTFVADFIGESTLVPVERCDEHGVMLGEQRLQTARPVPVGSSLFAALRAEKLLLEGECPEAVNVLCGTLEDVVFQGESLLLLACLPGGHRVTMRRMCNGPGIAGLPTPGEPIRFALKPTDTVVVPQHAQG